MHTAVSELEFGSQPSHNCHRHRQLSRNQYTHIYTATIIMDGIHCCERGTSGMWHAQASSDTSLADIWVQKGQLKTALCFERKNGKHTPPVATYTVVGTDCECVQVSEWEWTVEVSHHLPLGTTSTKQCPMQSNALHSQRNKKAEFSTPDAHSYLWNSAGLDQQRCVFIEYQNNSYSLLVNKLLKDSARVTRWYKLT